MSCQCDADLDEDFSFLQPLDLITKDVNELKKVINERRKKLQKDRNKESEKGTEGDHGRVREKERQEREKECEKDKEKVENLKEPEQHHENQTSGEMVTAQEDKLNVKHEENGTLGGNHLFPGVYIVFYQSVLCSMFCISCSVAALFFINVFL